MSWRFFLKYYITFIFIYFKKTKVKKVPDYTDKIKELLNVDKPSRDLLFAVIDRIEIDQYRNIEIYYKFNLIKKDVFKYKEIESPRNPYGPKGKPKKKWYFFTLFNHNQKMQEVVMALK